MRRSAGTRDYPAGGRPPGTWSAAWLVFVHFYGDRVVLLLSGYDKGSDPSDKRQQREISRARKCLTAWHEQQKRQRKAKRGEPGAGRAARS